VQFLATFVQLSFFTEPHTWLGSWKARDWCKKVLNISHVVRLVQGFITWILDIIDLHDLDI